MVFLICKHNRRLSLLVVRINFFFFFFQAEDGIRDIGVTGVQTCALPILVSPSLARGDLGAQWLVQRSRWMALARRALAVAKRSEERRVGKECRSRRAT